ncbi:MAG TPA: hypothetical protein VF715_08455 [Thermoleophilaceae bacterium]
MRVLLLIVVLALALPATASAEVTLKVGGSKYREVLYPDTFRVKGKTGAYRGPVTLEIDEFPFDGNYADTATVNTDEEGEYVFPKIGPTRNALLRARAGAERSKPLSVFVHPGVKLSYRTTSSGRRVKISFTYIGHPGFAPPQRFIYAYIVKNNREPARRLGGKRALTQTGDGRWRYAATSDLPASRSGYRYFLVFCSPGLASGGYGRAYAVDRHCGEKSFKLGSGA